MSRESYGVQPGELRSFERDANVEVAVGARVAIVTRHNGGSGAYVAGYRVDPRGPWEVVGVQPVRGHTGRVRVYLEAL